VGTATLKGVDLGFTLRRVKHIDASLGYCLSFAEGTSPESNTRNVAFAGSQPQQEWPLDFDRRHKLSVNLGLSYLKSEGPKWRDHTPLADVDVNVLYNLASGARYTPATVSDEVSLLNTTAQPTGTPNEQTGPFTQTLDFKITKAFRVGGPRLDAYVWALNAFNAHNALLVYQGTGSPYTTGFLETAEGQVLADQLRREGIDPDHAYGLATQKADLFSYPRTIRFGLRMGF
jgi:hypothetical protein